jgi:hypothetical protein
MRRLALIAVCLIAAVPVACGGETEPASNVTQTTAKLNGKGRCKGDWGPLYNARFQIRQQGGAWRDVPGNLRNDAGDPFGQTLDCPSETGHITFHQNATGLQPGTSYQFRLAIDTEPGGGGYTFCEDSVETADYGDSCNQPSNGYNGFTTDDEQEPPPPPPPASGAGADAYRAAGNCPAPVTSGTQVPRGGSVPSGASTVLLERGGSYTVNPRSGLTVGAYGSGANPRINAQGVNGLGNVRYDSVDVPSVSGSGSGASGPISVTNSRLGGTAISINTTGSFNTGPAWTVACNDIGTAGLGANGDSCVLMLSPGSNVVGNRISGCGGGVSYGTHGVYAKAENVTMAWNTVGTVTNGQAFSVRCRGARVLHNRYDGSGYGAFLDWYGQCPAQDGLVEVAYNDVTMIPMWLDPHDGMGNEPDWRFRHNTLRARAGSGGCAVTGGMKSGEAATWEITDNQMPGFSCPSSLNPRPTTLIQERNTF